MCKYYLKCIIFIVALVQNSSLISQKTFKIYGTVVNDSNEPLTGVLVWTDKADPSYTGVDGKFNINATPGLVSVSLKSLGSEDIEIQKTIVDKDVDLGRIKMTEKAILMKEVNISATPLSFKSTVEGTNYYVSPLQLKKMQPISTEEILKTLPGVNVLGDQGLSNRINVSIRGSWGRRSEKILMLEDGSPISPAPYTAPGIYYNPISERVDGIEVLTGADILRFGPNNMFGIINYITPKPPQEPALRFKVSGGQRGYFTGLLSYGGTWNKVGSQVEAVFKRFDGFTKNSALSMINLNAKIFAELAENQSLYFKVSGQFEDNQASLSSITPYTYSIDPTEGPFDADRFTMHRYGLDIIHKWVPDKSTELTSKIFASDFARDWWRQSSTVIRVADVRSYLGEKIFSERYKYLEGQTYKDDDFVRVGAINNKRESTSDSRWNFTVAAMEETFTKKWKSSNWSNQLEAQIRIYNETYKDQVIAADSSRWARSGRFTTDLAYDLQSVSGYIRNHFTLHKFEFTPILRLEKVWMDREDNLANANIPDITGVNNQKRVNTYQIFQPGISLGYVLEDVKVFGSVFRGYIAPSKYFAFLVERDGILTNPLSPQELSNVQPEVSINTELGLRGDLIKDKISGQVAVFRNQISNFYLAGWNEFFDKLGTIQIKGVEATFRWEILPVVGEHRLSIQPNITLLSSKVLSGELVDRHLFTQIKHTTATKQEFVGKVNSNPNAYEIFIQSADGTVTNLKAPIHVEDLDKIVKTVYKFGKNGINDGVTPYAPRFAYNMNINYQYIKWSVGVSYNYVSDQYAEFANFENESGDGGVGKIKAFHTFDANISYDIEVKRMKYHLFVAAKNLGNDIFVASRLNRGQSGIMPGGFRQVNAGINLSF